MLGAVKQAILLTLPLFIISAPAARAATITLSGVNLSTPPAQVYSGPGGGVFYNGSDNAGGFTAGGAFFRNEFTDWGEWGTSWTGWSYSTTSDTTTPGFVNQYSAFVNTGNNRPYAVGYGSGARIDLPSGLDTPLSVTVANTTYAALSMRNGDSFAKKFGGASGNDPDYFYVDFTGLDSNNTVLGSVRFYLADFRFADNSLDYIISDWTTVDLTSLGSGIHALTLKFGSSDTGDWGINTPTYIALDSLSVVPEPGTYATLAALVALASTMIRRRS
jgi:hypothetical protein